jgi:hypothetical protein
MFGKAKTRRSRASVRGGGYPGRSASPSQDRTYRELPDLKPPKNLLRLPNTRRGMPAAGAVVPQEPNSNFNKNNLLDTANMPNTRDSFH